MLIVSLILYFVYDNIIKAYSLTLQHTFTEGGFVRGVYVRTPAVDGPAPLSSGLFACRTVHTEDRGP